MRKWFVIIGEGYGPGCNQVHRSKPLVVLTVLGFTLSRWKGVRSHRILRIVMIKLLYIEPSAAHLLGASPGNTLLV